jgi:hypothetical protein
VSLHIHGRHLTCLSQLTGFAPDKSFRISEGL